MSNNIEIKIEMNKEDEKLDGLRNGNPFGTPENYFQNLTEQIMNKLPEKENSFSPDKQPTLWAKIRPWLYMAAMFIGIMLPIRYMMKNSENEKEVMIENEVANDEYIETIMDYSMMDEYALYDYLTNVTSDSNHN